MADGFWISLFHIIMIDLVLSGDNAVVIGMACRGLPERQRRKAVVYGTLGAVLLRVTLTGVATWILDIPLVKAVGGVLLLWIAFRLADDRKEELSDVALSRNLAQAVKTIVAADFIMSMDNVLAIGGAADGDILLVLFGLGLSIPLLMWGSTWAARLMERHAVLVAGGAAILAYTAVEMCLEDPYVWQVANPLLFNHMLLPFAAGCLVFGWVQWAKGRGNRP